MGSFLLMMVVGLNLVLLVLVIALWRRGAILTYTGVAQVARNQRHCAQSLSQAASATADMATRLRALKATLRRK
jgi:hypothetical protein